LFEEKYESEFYINLQQSLKEHKPDIVVISTSSQSHSHILKEVVEYSKPKVILCEKPLSYNLNEAYSMQKICQDNNVKLFVNYIRISQPNSIEIKNKIDNGTYAGSLKGVVWYSKGLIHNGSHFVNLLEYWLGPIMENRCISKGRLIDSLDVEPDFILSFARGRVIFISTKEEKFSNYAIELMFENGRLRYERGGREVNWAPAQHDKDLPMYKFLSNENTSYSMDSMKKYQLHVVNELWNMLNQKSYQLCSDTMAISTLKSIYNIMKVCK
jgi:predicted dehydrogenase